MNVVLRNSFYNIFYKIAGSAYKLDTWFWLYEPKAPRQFMK